MEPSIQDILEVGMMIRFKSWKVKESIGIIKRIDNGFCIVSVFRAHIRAKVLFEDIVDIVKKAKKNEL